MCTFALKEREQQSNKEEIMPEEVLHSYRLTSMEEPTDEMLHAIMEKVAEAARESTRRVQLIHQQRLANISARRHN